MTAEGSCEQPRGRAPVCAGLLLPARAAGEASLPGMPEPIPGYPLPGHLPAILPVTGTPDPALLLPRVPRETG